MYVVAAQLKVFSSLDSEK
jgi:hypothetical protein